jgi:hypothetical protein
MFSMMRVYLKKAFSLFPARFHTIGSLYIMKFDGFSW